MRYSDSIFGHLLKAIPRRWFDGLVDRHAGNAYDKSFGSWEHLLVLICAQLGGIGSLRGLEAAWNANAHHHYHLGVGKLARSTLSDANARRPLAIFTETFAKLSGLASRTLRREGDEMIRLIDATPVPLGKLIDLGQVEWPYQGPEAACRLRSGIGQSHRDRHDRCQRQRYRGRPENVDSCRVTPMSSTRPIADMTGGSASIVLTPVRDPRQDQLAIPRNQMAACRAKHRRRLHHHRRCRGQAGQQGQCQARHPDAAGAHKARQRGQGSASSPTTSNAPPSRSQPSTKPAGRSSCCSAGSSSISRSGPSSAATPNAIRLQLVAAMIAYVLLRIAAPRQSNQNTDPPLRRADRRQAVHAKGDRSHRQASAGQPRKSST